MFSDEFRERLKRGKYSRWATDLTEDQLEALLWAVGEFGVRSSDVLGIVRQQTPTTIHPRATLALDVLADFTRGDRINLANLSEQIQNLRRPAT